MAGGFFDYRGAKLSPLNLNRVRASKPGGTYMDWDKSLWRPFHHKGKNIFMNTVGRIEWDKPAGTITTGFYLLGSGRNGHPEQDRALSLREGAILQSFPDSYIFDEPDKPKSLSNVARLIGNAVPVLLGEVIGASIVESCKKV